MKKNIILSMILTVFAANIPAYSFNFLYPIKPDNKKQIMSVLKDYDKAIKNHNIDNVKSFYASDYKSSDGFNLDNYVEMLKKTYDSYGNIKYKTRINNITSFDNWAIAQMSDTTSAKIYPEGKVKNKAKVGILDGKSSYIVYLKNTKDGWKIVSDDVLMEETSLKYGVANKINMNLITPVFVENGKEYDISLKIDKPDNIFAIASLSREEIVYPPVNADEKYRKFPESGELERLVTANNKNLDEYAVASVGFTKVSISEEELKAKIEVLGMAYIMKRINTQKLKELSENSVKTGENVKN